MALLQRIKMDEEFILKKLGITTFSGDSFSSLYDAISNGGKWKDMLHIVKKLEEGEITFGTSRKETIANKKIVLEVLKRGFLKALSVINDKNAKVAKAKMALYQPLSPVRTLIFITSLNQ